MIPVPPVGTPGSGNRTHLAHDGSVAPGADAAGTRLTRVSSALEAGGGAGRGVHRWLPAVRRHGTAGPAGAGPHRHLRDRTASPPGA